MERGPMFAARGLAEGPYRVIQNMLPSVTKLGTL